MRSHPSASRLESIYTGSAADLTRFDSKTFDTVLCMGALYHLPNASDRDAVMRECLRVLKPGGCIVCAWQSYLAICLARLLRAMRQSNFAARREAFAQLEESRRSHCRDIFYGMTVDEIEPFASTYALKRITNAATYPALYSICIDVESYESEAFEEYVCCLYETCEDESAVKYTMHGLYIAQKP